MVAVIDDEDRLLLHNEFIDEILDDGEEINVVFEFERWWLPINDAALNFPVGVNWMQLDIGTHGKHSDSISFLIPFSVDW